eukprot:CAMPEP_0174748804 /NCGR_PEP_ID=MMETSP1094-20130205/94318_1 /TAXON_ID=156173 /ORGANISM="Chrysochromulina brevifilum, Strain UTEX LB 985" /LENGTH=82 /DNA_ID=CAMNT_0015953913 /DNA_START=345 /DNA_END=593 /DNA_ORIENTATION=+
MQRPGDEHTEAEVGGSQEGARYHEANRRDRGPPIVEAERLGQHHEEHKVMVEGIEARAHYEGGDGAAEAADEKTSPEEFLNQ